MNSTRIISYPINSPGIIAARMWIREGSRADPIDQKGIHHLLGSLLSRGCGPYDNDDLGDLIEGSGASLQCETYEDGILLRLKCIDNDIFKLIPVLGWMLESPHLDEEYINLERDLSIKALKRQKENPFYLAFDGWRNLAYSDGPYGHDPLGTIEDLQNINKSTLIKLSNELLTREKTLVIAGSLPTDINAFLEEIKPFKSTLKNAEDQKPSNNPKTYQLSKSTYQSSNLCLAFEDTSQVIIMLGKSTIPYRHKDDLLLRLLSCHLGSGMSSKLFIKLREEHGVAYDVGIYHPIREGETPFVIHASTSIKKAIFTLNLLKDEWNDLIHNTITEEDLELAKAKFKGQVAHSSQTVGQRAERKAHLLGQNLHENYETEILKKLQSITSKDLQEVGQKHLEKPLLSLCGPQKILLKLSREWNN
tara:strand:+ start:352 stop:1611 length:1260 start_codon:yes stop_codon:yes gene_type:complete